MSLARQTPKAPATPGPEAAKAPTDSATGAGNAAAQEATRSAPLDPRGPYSRRYANTSLSDAFSVDAGQLTFDAEGTEGGALPHPHRPRAARPVWRDDRSRL